MRRCYVGDDRACHLAGRRAHIHVDLELIERSIQFEIERRLQTSAAQGRNEARQLRQRELVRRDLHVDDGRRQILLNGAINRQRAFRRTERDLLHKYGVVANRHAAGERVEGNLRVRPAERHLGDVDRVPNRRVMERELRVEMLESFRQHDIART